MTTLQFSSTAWTYPAVSLSFVTGYPVTGWQATRFGTPSIALAVTPLQPVHFGIVGLAVPVVGFKPITFGLPTANPLATGFRAIHFGGPHVPVFITGWKPTHFGIPQALGVFQVDGFLAANFGQVGILPHAVGFKPLHIGSPGIAIVATALRPVNFGTLTHKTGNHVEPFRAIHVGTPTVPTARTCAVSGFRTGRVPRGGVAIRYRSGPPGFVAAMHHPLHFRITHPRLTRFGTPGLGQVLPVASIQLVHFGTASMSVLDGTWILDGTRTLNGNIP